LSVAASCETGGRAAERRPPAGAAQAPLVARGVSKRFGPATALAGVDLDVRPGAVVGLVGPNGSGKTTLLHAVAGLLPIDAGSIRVAGAEAGSRAARTATALIPDEPSGFDELTVTELVSLVHVLWAARPVAAARAEVLMTAFGLDERRDQRLGTLSRGLRRQASAVAALSLASPLILVDEATATLDPEAVVVLGEAVATLAERGCGVLLATQDLHFAGAVCHEIVLLHRGVVMDRGEPGALRARHAASSLEDVFLAALGDRRLRERVRGAFEAL
jgi:ABC-2 type transport system ATP-binding protein